LHNSYRLNSFDFINVLLVFELETPSLSAPPLAIHHSPSAVSAALPALIFRQTADCCSSLFLVHPSPDVRLNRLNRLKSSRRHSIGSQFTFDRQIVFRFVYTVCPIFPRHLCQCCSPHSLTLSLPRSHYHFHSHVFTTITIIIQTTTSTLS
jgi:hypothetical protein